jgi:two-component system sensor histidine kinase QseC
VSRRLRSLQGRLLALVLAMVVLVWIGAGVATWVDARHELDELLDSHLAQAAALLVVQQVRELDDDAHRAEAPSLHRYAPKVAFQIFDGGRLVLRSANAPAAPMLAGAHKQFRDGFATVRIDGAGWRVFSARGVDGDVRVLVGEQMASRTSILWAVLRSSLWPMLVSLPLLALGAAIAVHRGLAPLRRLGRALAQRRPQALEPVAADDAPAEMLPLIAALNGLFGRIDGLLAAERRFTADAAHELRTPIAAIRAQAQVALGESDAARQRHALEQTIEGCDRAARLVEQMLTLARLEAGRVAGVAAVDLAALARRIAAELAPRALAKRQTLALDAPVACVVDGDESLLAVLVRNLLDNAIRYSPVGARVDAAVGEEAGRVVFSVHDSGPGLDAAALARLGERFFRVAGNDESGSGLGWSIVRRIADAHGLRLHVERSARLGGLAVRVEFPRSERRAGNQPDAPATAKREVSSAR